MKLLQTNNGRLRIDPSCVLAIELETVIKGIDVGPFIAIITLERGITLHCTQEEATELAIQWEAYLAELDPDDDEDEDDDSDDDDEIEVPETIDITPEKRTLKRRKIHG